MSNLSNTQKDFFNALSELQQRIVNVTLSKEYDNKENMLYDVTYDTIYNIMELIDGYTNDSLQLDLVLRHSKDSLRTGIELHDTCAEYLRCTKSNK